MSSCSTIDPLASRVASRYATKLARFEAMKQIGQICVETGTVLVIDPCFAESWGSGEHPDLSTEGYRKAWHEGRNQLYFANGVPAAVFIKGFGGDGSYPVLIEGTPPGQPDVGSLTVDFNYPQIVTRVATRYRASRR